MSGSVNFNSVQSVSGLASGLDTNSIVTQLMAIERQPQVRIQQRQTVEIARQETLTSIQTQLQNVQSAYQALSDPTLWANQQSVTSNDPTKVSASFTSGAAGAPPGGYNITVSQLARAQQVTQTGSTTGAVGADTLQISVGGSAPISVAIHAGDSIDQIASDINATSGIGVFASVVNGKLVLSGMQTGAASTIAVSSTGTLAADLGLAETQAGLDAMFTVSGTPETSASNLVTTAITGATLGLTGLTSSPVTVLVGAPGPNQGLVTSKIQTFVDTYNTAVAFIQSQLNQKPVANPQTDADRIQGVLFGDPGISQLLATMREAVGSAVSGRPSNLSTLAQAGLSTGAADSSGTLNQDSLDGKLTFDTTQFSTMLATNFQGVKALFSNNTGSYASEGLAQRFSSVVDPYLGSGGVMASRVKSEQSILDDLKQQSADMDIRLALKQQMLQTQFTNMEIALSQAQSAAGAFGAQLTSLSGSGSSSSSSGH